MFYSQEDVESELYCPLCNRKYDEPRRLPCGRSICTKCKDSFVPIENKNFKCPLCNLEHVKSRSDLPVDYSLQKFLILNPIEVNRGDLYKEAQFALKDVRRNLNDLKQEIASYRDRLGIYCKYIKDEIEITTESKIAYLNQSKDDFIKIIEKYEADCIERINGNKTETFEEFENFVEESMRNYGKWNEILKTIKGNDIDIVDVIRDAKVLLKSLDYYKVKFDRLLFTDDKPCFLQNDKIITSVDTNWIGKLVSSSFKLKNLKEVHSISYSEGMATVRSVFMDVYKEDSIVLAVNLANSFEYYHIMLKIIQDGKVIQQSDTKQTTIDEYINGICCVDDKIIVATSFNQYTLKMYNKSLKIIKEISLKYEVQAMYSVGNEIHVLLNRSEFPFIYIFNDKLQFIGSYGQRTDPNAPFYLKTSSQVYFKNEFIFTFDGSSIDKLARSTGIVVKTIQANRKNNLFCPYTNNSFFLLNQNDKQLSLYDMEGEVIDSIEILKEIPDVTSFCTNIYSELIVNDLKNRKIHVLK